MSAERSLQAQFLTDENGNIVGVVLDGSIYRLQTVGKVLNSSGSQIDPATQATLADADTKLGTIDSVLDSIKDTDGVKKITDALPAGDNAIGRIRLVNSANTKIVTVIDDATEATNKRLLVEADFKPGIYIGTQEGSTVENPAAEVKQNLEDSGGSSDLGVDGSGTPVEFTFDADPTDDIRLASLRFVLICNTIRTDVGSFGPLNSALTNGVKVEVRSNSVTTQIALLKETVHFLGFHGPSSQPFDRSGSYDQMIIQHSFGGTKLFAGTGDFVKVTVQDDLSSNQFEYFFVSVAGQKVTS